MIGGCCGLAFNVEESWLAVVTAITRDNVALTSPWDDAINGFGSDHSDNYSPLPLLIIGKRKMSTPMVPAESMSKKKAIEQKGQHSSSHLLDLIGKCFYM